MPTRDQITTKVLQNLENSGASFFTASQVNDSIQDGYDDVCAYCGQLEKSISVDFQANLTYYNMRSLVPDFMAVVAVYNYNTKRWLIDSNSKELDQVRWDWETWIGQPIWFFPHDFQYMAICPKLSSNNGNMEVFYRAQATTLIGASVPRIKSNSVKLLEFYATGDLLESVKEYIKADIWLGQYKELRERYKTDVKSLAEADRIATIQQNSLRIAT